MAKSLKGPPSSSVARFFDPEVTARVSGPARPPEPPSHSSHIPDTAEVRPRWVKREFTLTGEADWAFSRLVAEIREATGARVTNSHVLRAIIHAIEASYGQVAAELRAVGRLGLPSNAADRAHDRLRFERRIALAIERGIRVARRD